MDLGAIANTSLVTARRISNCSKGLIYIKQPCYSWPYIVLSGELASHGKQQVLVKQKVMYTFLSNLLLG